jgi:D-beta-D-heptose 7-phosphate kinase/D-beta-D-heptose 1-phosphate adenosyltransferase
MPQKFKHSKVLIVGDVMLDRYWSGSTSRISPEAPVMVVNVKDQKETVGGAANVALNIAALEGKATLIGMIGNDDAGQKVDALLEHDHIDHYLQKSDRHPTITKLRVLSQRQQMIRLDFEESFKDVAKTETLKQFEKALPDADLVILSDYNKGTLSDPQALIQLARNHNKPVLIDPKGHDFSKYRGASLIKPNQKEFEAVVGECPTEAIMIEKAKQQIATLDLQGMLITRGGKGMLLVMRDGTVSTAAAHSGELIDVSGAGDTVIATFALALASDYSHSAAMHLANLAASIVVAKLGTATVSNAELTKAHLGQHHTAHAILTREALAEQVKQAQTEGETVVFTNGCFDILHAGHVEYLQKAKALGDRLVVAVNDDASVSRLKGPTRPASPLESRLKVLAALEAVDWVVPFNEDTPENLLRLLKPDVLVKGGDYDDAGIVGHEIVKNYGGKVLPIKHDYLHISSTKIIDKMKAK